LCRCGNSRRRGRFRAGNAPEREAVKQELLARIDAAALPEIVIASSSSGC